MSLHHFFFSTFGICSTRGESSSPNSTLGALGVGGFEPVDAIEAGVARPLPSGAETFDPKLEVEPAKTCCFLENSRRLI
jgi:hypothetical protein